MTTETENTEAVDAAPEVAEDVKPQKKYYGFDVVGDFKISNGTVIEQDADAAAPANTTEWQPPEAPADGVYYQYDGAWVLGIDVRKAAIADLQASALVPVQAAFEAAVAQLQSAYTTSERASWAQQLSEAQGLIAGTTKEPPLLTALASARGLDVKALAQKIVDKNNAYQSAYASALATFQKARDAISAAKQLSDLTSMDVPYLARAYAKARK